MKTITHSGGMTSAAMTYVGREVPVIKAFPALGGAVKSVQIKTTLHTDSGSSLTVSCPVYLFKTFGGDAAYWEARTDNMYQYPGDNNHWLKAEYIGDILATATFTGTITEGEITCPLNLTDYGKSLANWAGDVYLAVLTDETHLYWGETITSEITLEYNNGVVKHGVNGAFVDCEMHIAVNGAWQQVQPYKGADGTFHEIGS